MNINLLLRAFDTFEIFDYVNNATYDIFENSFQEYILEVL